MMTPNNQQRYWRANLKLITSLLSIWAIVSLGFSILLVEPLNNLQFGTLPLGFWFAQQGSIYVFVILIFVYAFQMDKIDRRYGDRLENRADELDIDA
jgi:putative solute:sodium symporter small subunit